MPEIHNDHGNDCLICSEDGAKDPNYYELSCKHGNPTTDFAMHQKCLSTWVKKNATCPYCRAKISEGDLWNLEWDD